MIIIANRKIDKRTSDEIKKEIIKYSEECKRHRYQLHVGSCNTKLIIDNGANHSMLKITLYHDTVVIIYSCKRKELLHETQPFSFGSVWNTISNNKDWNFAIDKYVQIPCLNY